MSYTNSCSYNILYYTSASLSRNLRVGVWGRRWSSSAMSSAQPSAQPNIVQLPELVLQRIADFLAPEDIARLAQTCKRLHATLPHFMVIYGKDFHIRGPDGGHWAPEPYFDGPTLTARVRRLTMSVVWKDQGWGNQKGEIFLSLMRGRPSEVIVEKRKPLGIAPHKQEKATAELRDHTIVTLAQPGDYYRFTRNAGGGGGHQLSVKNFKVVVELQS